MTDRHRVVIVGSGFGGLFAAKALRGAQADVTLISGTTYHLFEPLLYQVASGILSEGEVAPPIREILKGRRDLDVRLGWVTDVDVAAKTVLVNSPDGRDRTVPYDSLIVAAGAQNSYFGNEQFAEHAPSLKNIDDALELRSRIFHAFEMADLEEDPEARRRWLTFVLIGAGPTGVEMAGQIAELAHRALKGQYRHADLSQTQIILIDAVDRVLPAFDPSLSAKARKQLTKMGVDVRLNTRVVDVDATGVEVKTADGGRAHRGEHEDLGRRGGGARHWRPGSRRPPASRPTGPAGSASAPTSPCRGIRRSSWSATWPPPTCPAWRRSRCRAAATRRRPSSGGWPASRRASRSSTSTRATWRRSAASRAVADLGKLHFGGILGWLLWLVIHLFYLIGFKNKVTTLMHWTVSFLGRGRSERISTVQQINARTALNRLDR